MAIRFGEFLVQRGLIDRFQLLRVLQFQSRHPGARLGECVVACGFLGLVEIELSLAEHAAESAPRLARGTSSVPVIR